MTKSVQPSGFKNTIYCSKPNFESKHSFYFASFNLIFSYSIDKKPTWLCQRFLMSPSQNSKQVCRSGLGITILWSALVTNQVSYAHRPEGLSSITLSCQVASWRTQWHLNNPHDKWPLTGLSSFMHWSGSLKSLSIKYNGGGDGTLS